MTIKDLKPSVVWNNFYLLTRQPRPSKHEEKVRAFLLQWGKDHNIETFADEGGNVIMRVPATAGYEKRRGVILQAHMDMVPQKIASSNHDFLTDPIETVVDGDWLTANGTTLGADDGLGVAFAMAVAESKDVKHGPLELLFTYDEETGMSGAEALKPGVLKGDILINIDSEDDDELCIGCAGGLDAVADPKFKTEKTPKGYVGYKLSVGGLQGGHSGMDISLYRANANKVIAFALLPVMEKYGVKLADICGGSLRNAIPFEAEATILVPEAKAGAVVKSVRKYFEETTLVYKESDPSMNCIIAKEDKPAKTYIEDNVAINAIKGMIACPSNVIRMSQSMPGLTETSINMAVVRCKAGHLTVASLMRSAIDSSKDELARRVKVIFELAGAQVRFVGGYSGWVPKPDTPLIKVMADIYEQMFKEKMHVRATHGGLECALLGAKYPNWEMVSIGPTVRFPHSPDERTYIPSAQKMWDYIKKVLETIE